MEYECSVPRVFDGIGCFPQHIVGSPPSVVLFRRIEGVVGLNNLSILIKICTSGIDATGHTALMHGSEYYSRLSVPPSCNDCF
jgi:hypothetical protein